MGWGTILVSKNGMLERKYRLLKIAMISQISLTFFLCVFLFFLRYKTGVKLTFLIGNKNTSCWWPLFSLCLFGNRAQRASLLCQTLPLWQRSRVILLWKKFRNTSSCREVRTAVDLAQVIGIFFFRPSTSTTN